MTDVSTANQNIPVSTANGKNEHLDTQQDLDWSEIIAACHTPQTVEEKQAELDAALAAIEKIGPSSHELSEPSRSPTLEDADAEQLRGGKREIYDSFGLSAHDAAGLRRMAVAINSRHRKIFDQIVATGRDLIMAKKLLGHGNFGEWLTIEFGWSDRTAQNYMALAALVDELPADKTETVSYLPLRTAYFLASQAVPPSVRSDVLGRIAGGEKVDEDEIKQLLRPPASILSSMPASTESVVTKEHSASPTAKCVAKDRPTKPRVTPEIRAAVLANLNLLEKVYSEISDPEDFRTFLEQSNRPDCRAAVLVSMSQFSKRLRQRELTSGSASPIMQVS